MSGPNSNTDYSMHLCVFVEACVPWLQHQSIVKETMTLELLKALVITFQVTRSVCMPSPTKIHDMVLEIMCQICEKVMDCFSLLH